MSEDHVNTNCTQRRTGRISGSSTRPVGEDRLERVKSVVETGAFLHLESNRSFGYTSRVCGASADVESTKHG